MNLVRKRRHTDKYASGARDHRRADGRPKRWYPTREAADAVAARMRVMAAGDKEPYECSHCDGWHIGTPRRIAR